MDLCTVERNGAVPAVVQFLKRHRQQAVITGPLATSSHGPVNRDSGYRFAAAWARHTLRERLPALKTDAQTHRLTALACSRYSTRAMLVKGLLAIASQGGSRGG